VVDPEVSAAAEELLGGSGRDDFACSICDKEFTTRRALAMHGRVHARERKQAPARPAAPESAVQAVVEEAVGNAIVIGGYLSILLPHLGTAIAGVPSDDPERPVVRSRAEMAGGILIEHARRNPAVLNALERFNSLLKSSAVVEIAGSLAAAAAVDVGLVDPNMSIEVGPFQGEHAIRPVRAVIGDVVTYVEAARTAQAAANGRAYPQPDERRAQDGATVIQGGVEDT
jgi:hypothetical protein